jgi:hypothetical protein
MASPNDHRDTQAFVIAVALIRAPRESVFLQPQRRIERPMADIISGNIKACPIGPL